MLYNKRKGQVQRVDGVGKRKRNGKYEGNT